MPEGNLTPAQHEILDIVWDAGHEGATVAEIWQAIATQRSVGRTTILNLVDRLEKRNWLRRRDDSEGANRYLATVSRERTAAGLAKEFVNDFFEGSASNLVMSLLGSNTLSKSELQRLRAALDQSPTTKSRKLEGRS
jgi:predicted transcriptional regulator